MLTLSEYINTLKPESISHYPYNWLKEQLNDYNCNMENDNVMYCHDYNDYYSYIEENLKTYMISKVIDSISRYIKDNNIQFEYDNDELNTRSNFSIVMNKTLYNKYTDKLNNILQFYNYYITLTDYINTFEIRLYIEPLYSESADDFIYNECNGILYHFCIPPVNYAGKTVTDTNKVADSIEKSGLRIKSSDYRYYPNKIFCYCDKKTDLLKSDADKIKDFLYIIYNNNAEYIKQSLDKINIFKIDLNKYNHFHINWYTDAAMPSDNCVYTFTNINKKVMTRFNSKQLNLFKEKIIDVL